MSSGIDALEETSGAMADPIHQCYAYEASLGNVEHYADAPHTQDVVKSLKRCASPRTIHQYNWVNTFVLGWIIEEVM